MREIKLTQGQVAFVDDYHFDWLNQWKWCAIKLGSTFYAIRGIRINGKLTTQYMHKLIMGENQLKPYIDHEDGKGWNNQIYNLRRCTNQENQMNRKPNKNSSSIYQGVSWNVKCKKWKAQIRVKGKLIYLGVFSVEEDAARAYDAAATIHFKSFKRLNFPENK